MEDNVVTKLSHRDVDFSLVKKRANDRHNSFSFSFTRNYTYSPKAWRLLSVGSYEEANQVSRVENDIVCLAASFIMSGYVSKAILILEAYIIALCIVEYEKFTTHDKSDYYYFQRLGDIMESWITERNVTLNLIEKNTKVTRKEEYCTVILNICTLVDWDSIHRWFLIALCLRNEEPYKLPKLVWFYYFFALFESEDFSKTNGGTQSLHKSHQQITFEEKLCGEDVKKILFAQCEKWEVDFISTITFWHTHYYRSAIAAATKFLNVEKEGFKITNINMRIMACFIRCMSLIEIGERTIAINDALEIMRDEDEFISTVGAGIIAFLIPLPQAVKCVTSYVGTIGEQRYVYGLCEYVHALTLVQLGSMQAAVRVLKSAIPFAPKNNVGEWLLDLLVIACSSLEDSLTILSIPLNPQRQLYLAMCPVFFGGFGKDCTKLRSRSPAGRLLYRSALSTAASLRVVLAVHMMYAHNLVQQRKYFEAWDNVCIAVGCAEEIIGSVEYAFTDCSPLRVYFFGCRVGGKLLEILLEVMTKRGTVGNIKSTHRSTREVLEEGNHVCEEVLRKCFHWAQRIRQFHPNVRLGSVIMSEYSNFSHGENFLSRAISLAWRYPNCVLAQNCLTLALYMNHHIPEAVDHATKSLQTFPHSHEVNDVYRHILQKDGVYLFNYRTLLPVHYASCTNHSWTIRMLFMMILLILNVVIFVLTLVANLSMWITYPEAIKEFAVRVQLPFLFPLLYGLLTIVYAILAVISKHNLVRTIIQDLFFCDTRLNRFLFPLRGFALLNISNAIQITVAGNNFLFASHWSTLLLYLFMLAICVPFTSRVWFLSSVDEPKEYFCTWLTILCIDILSTLFLIVPHVLLFAVEPFMFIVFFFLSLLQSTQSNVSGDVIRRLRIHQLYLKKMPSSYTEENRSNFIHVRLMSLLYYKTHPNYTTKRLVKSQIDEDNYRVFPLIELYERISTKPIDYTGQRDGIEFQEGRTAADIFFTDSKDASNTKFSDDDDDDDNLSGEVPFFGKNEETTVNNDLAFDNGDRWKEEGIFDTRSESKHVDDASDAFKKSRKKSSLRALPNVVSLSSLVCVDDVTTSKNVGNVSTRGDSKDFAGRKLSTSTKERTSFSRAMGNMEAQVQSHMSSQPDARQRLAELANEVSDPISFQARNVLDATKRASNSSVWKENV